MVHGRRVSIGGYCILLIFSKEMLWIRILWVSRLLCFHVLTEFAFGVVGSEQLKLVDTWSFGAAGGWMWMWMSILQLMVQL